MTFSIAVISSADPYTKPKIDAFRAACAALGYHCSAFSAYRPMRDRDVSLLGSPADAEALGRRGDVDIAIPLDDRAVELAEIVNRTIGRFPMGDGIVELTDKLRFARACERSGIPTPRTMSVFEWSDLRHADFPDGVMVKPLRGTGSIQVRYFENVGSLLATFTEKTFAEYVANLRVPFGEGGVDEDRPGDGPAFLLQEYVSPAFHYTVHSFTREGSFHPLCWATTWNFPAPSRMSFAYAAPATPRPEHRARGEEILRELVSRLGIRWMWGTHELMVDRTGRILVTDPNPRVCGYTEIAMLNRILDADFLQTTLRALLEGTPLPNVRPDRYSCLRALEAAPGIVRGVALPDEADAALVVRPKPGDTIVPFADLGTPAGVALSESTTGTHDAFERAGSLLSRVVVEYA